MVSLIVRDLDWPECPGRISTHLTHQILPNIIECTRRTVPHPGGYLHWDGGGGGDWWWWEWAGLEPTGRASGTTLLTRPTGIVIESNTARCTFESFRTPTRKVGLNFYFRDFDTRSRQFRSSGHKSWSGTTTGPARFTLLGIFQCTLWATPLSLSLAGIPRSSRCAHERKCPLRKPTLTTQIHTSWVHLSTLTNPRPRRRAGGASPGESIVTKGTIGTSPVSKNWHAYSHNFRNQSGATKRKYETTAGGVINQSTQRPKNDG